MWSNQNVQISLGVDLTIKIVYGSKIKPKFCNVSTRQGGSFMAYLDCGICWLRSHPIQNQNLPICLDWGATPTRPVSSCPRGSSFSGNQLVRPKTNRLGRPEWSRSKPNMLLVMFACLIIRTFQLIFSAGTVFSSHNKSTITVFRLVFSAKRTGP